MLPEALVQLVVQLVWAWAGQHALALTGGTCLICQPPALVPVYTAQLHGEPACMPQISKVQQTWMVLGTMQQVLNTVTLLPFHTSNQPKPPTPLLLMSLMSYSPAAVSALLQVIVLASVALERRSRATHGCVRRKSAAQRGDA